jgi:hypothetical protein
MCTVFVIMVWSFVVFVSFVEGTLCVCLGGGPRGKGGENGERGERARKGKRELGESVREKESKEMGRGVRRRESGQVRMCMPGRSLSKWHFQVAHPASYITGEGVARARGLSAPGMIPDNDEVVDKRGHYKAMLLGHRTTRTDATRSNPTAICKNCLRITALVWPKQSPTKPGATIRANVVPLQTGSRCVQGGDGAGRAFFQTVILRHFFLFID